MSIALQARRLGLHAHAMAGFSRQKAYMVLNVSEDDYDILAAIAVGQRCEQAVLSKEAAAQEKPNERKSLKNVFAEGQFQKELI